METWGERRKRARGFYIDLLCSALWNGASFAEYVELELRQSEIFPAMERWVSEVNYGLSFSFHESK